MAQINLVVSVERREIIDDYERIKEENVFLTVQRNLLLVAIAILTVLIIAFS